MTECEGSYFDCPVRLRVWYTTLILSQLALYGTLTLLSRQFSYHSPGAGRPLGEFLAIAAAVFIASLCSIPLSLRLAHTKRSVLVFFVVAITARGIVLLSEPIQEVDLYRYIWDGAVSGQGISPYRYRPLEVNQAVTSGGSPSSPQGFDGNVLQLAALAVEQPALQEALQRIHFGELPTVYPPISQIVFRITNEVTPRQADLVTRVRIMKSVMLLFDMGVMFLMWKLLRLLKMNVGWIVAYGWSPLVIKEFANSGHLDSIAVFWVMASIVCAVIACQTIARFRIGMLIASGVWLGLGVGAKLFPVILFPVMIGYVRKQLGTWASVGWTLTASAIAVLSVAPQFMSELAHAPADPLPGLTTFLQRWEINDLIFMVVEENLRPAGTIAGQPDLWFVITPNSWRAEVTQTVSALGGLDPERTPFLLARLATTLLFALMVVLLSYRVWCDPLRLSESLFLVLAWFWLLSPTQNPWYWTWALPLVPFARSRAWLLVSGVVFLYYTRFWFEYHQPNWGAYQGVAIFDFIVVWIEFAPLLVILIFQRGQRLFGRFKHQWQPKEHY